MEGIVTKLTHLRNSVSQLLAEIDATRDEYLGGTGVERDAWVSLREAEEALSDVVAVGLAEAMRAGGVLDGIPKSTKAFEIAVEAVSVQIRKANPDLVENLRMLRRAHALKNAARDAGKIKFEAAIAKGRVLAAYITTEE